LVDFLTFQHQRGDTMTNAVAAGRLDEAALLDGMARDLGLSPEIPARPPPNPRRDGLNLSARPPRPAPAVRSPVAVRQPRAADDIVVESRPLPAQEPFLQRNKGLLIGVAVGVVLTALFVAIYGGNVLKIFNDGTASGALQAA